jgi:hypothetical protein
MYVVGPPRRPAPAGGTPQSVLLYDGCNEMVHKFVEFF